MTRTVGVVMIVLSVGLCVLGGSFLGVGVGEGSLELAGAILGLGLLIVFVVGPLAAGGVLVLARVRDEQAEQVQADRLRKIVDMVTTRGQMRLSDVVIELGADLPSVQSMIYKLVGMQVFSGYVNWDEGVLYSVQASLLVDTTQCKHCGGNLSLVGKGVVKCPYCETEYFLPSEKGGVGDA